MYFEVFVKVSQPQNDTRLLWTTWSVRTVMSDSDGTKIKGIVKHILWMAEILHHLGCKRKPINTGINYQPQLVQDFSINSTTFQPLGFLLVCLSTKTFLPSSRSSHQKKGSKYLPDSPNGFCKNHGIYPSTKLGSRGVGPFQPLKTNSKSRPKNKKKHGDWKMIHAFPYQKMVPLKNKGTFLHFRGGGYINVYDNLIYVL